MLCFACCGLKVAAMFKIGNSKDLPSIPDDLPEDGKDFVRLCLQRNPLHRPTAAQLLEHPFVKKAAPIELSDPPAGVPTAGKPLVRLSVVLSCLDLTKFRLMLCYFCISLLSIL